MQLVSANVNERRGSNASVGSLRIVDAAGLVVEVEEVVGRVVVVSRVDGRRSDMRTEVAVGDIAGCEVRIDRGQVVGERAAALDLQVVRWCRVPPDDRVVDI